MLLTIFQISVVKFSNQKAGPSLPLPLELPYLPYYMSLAKISSLIVFTTISNKLITFFFQFYH